MNSAPPAYPPEDLGQPKKHEQHLSYNLLRTANINPLSLLGLYALNGLLIALGAGLVLWSEYIWLGIALLLVSVFTGHAISRLSLGPKDPELQQRNIEIYDHLYEKTESNRLANLLLWNAAIEKVDLYGPSLKQVIKEVVKAGKNALGVGQTKCSGGHSGLCKHRIPDHLRQWIEDT